jgi:hypothetical protein
MIGDALDVFLAGFEKVFSEVDRGRTPMTAIG